MSTHDRNTADFAAMTHSMGEAVPPFRRVVGDFYAD